MLESTRLENRHSTTKAAIILALVVIAAYSPVIFLDQSYNRSTPIPKEFLDYHGKSILFPPTGDVYSDYQNIYPNIKLATDLLSKGNVPLWNPYIGVGQPLAADSEYHIFSPLILGFLLPVTMWDVPLLVALWIAGIFTFLFLRSLGLNFTSSVSGGVFYMLSGAMSWYLPNPNPMVTTFTPFILYSLEKIIQNRNLKYIPLASVAFSFGILGAHLESIILQFILVGLYLFYRILYPIFSNYRKNRIHKTNNASLLYRDPKRILTWSVLAFLGGLGLSAFFILPVYELVENVYLEHDTKTGTIYYSKIGLLQTFVPYILGQLHAYWLSPLPPVSHWGYVGIFALFFSILGTWLSLKQSNSIHRYTPLFFLSLSIFFIMKTVGIPVVNWIGYLPILNLMLFGLYVGAIIPIGFAVAAAFGIDLLTRIKTNTKTLGLVCIISISIILLLLIPLIPYLSPDAKFPVYITANDARNYVAFQIIQSVLFALMALLISIAISKNKSALVGIIPLILLELSLYIPLGLHPIWLAYKSIIVLAGMAIITFLVLKPNRFAWNLESRNVKLYVIIGVLIATFAGVILVSEFSPFGMMKRYDSFKQDPVTDFLKQNLGYSRMFSFDYTLGPDYPSPYKISTLGVLSSFSLNSFYSFLHSFLDKEANAARLGFPPWTYSYGPMDSIDKFQKNKRYFDFLGVKYILIQGYGLDSIAPGIPGLSGQYSKIGSDENSIVQIFTSPVNSISDLGISIGSSQITGNDKLILVLDSVPYDQRYHRESILNQTINQQYNEFTITPPLTDTLNKQFHLSLRSPQTDASKLAVVFTLQNNQTGYDFIKNNLNGRFYENGKLVDEKEMAFSITPESNKYPPVFTFHSINIYENKDAFPRLFLVNRFEVVDTGKAQEFLVKNPDFDLRHKVVLEEELPQEWIQQLKSSISNKSEAKIVLFSENQIKINTNNNDSSLLILTDAYYPGWKAFIDGKETHIYRGDGLVRTIFVPSGSHTIEFSYFPQSFVIGVIISLFTIISLVIILIISKRKLVIDSKPA